MNNNRIPTPIDPSTIQKKWESVEHLGSQIYVYRNIFTNEMNIVDRISSVLDDPSNNYSWQDSLVGFRQKIPSYRDCVDFKYRKSDLRGDDEASNKLKDIWQDCYDNMSEAVKDYCFKNNIIGLNYWEVMNFIRYGEGQHFQEHADHGFSYNSTVSLVGYPNDNYEGGELYFRLQNLTIKPKAGDLYIFPSSFTHPHRAMPVKSGIKYSLVTMLDYNEKFHTAKFYSELYK